MKPLIRKLDFTLAYLTEYIALLIVAFPILNYHDLFMSQLLPTLFMAAIMFLVHLKVGRIHPGIFIPSALISIIAGWLAGLPIGIALIFSALLLWRTFDVFKGLTFERLWIILGVLFGFSILYSYGLPAYFSSRVDRGSIMLLLVIGTLCVFLTQLVFMGFRQKKQRGRLTNSYIILSLSLMALLALTGNALKTLFSHFSWHFGNQQDIENYKPLKMDQIKENLGSPPSDFHIPHWLLVTIGVTGTIIFVFLILGIVKWNWGKGYFQRGTEAEMFTGHAQQFNSHSIEKPMRKGRLRAPKDPVRLELYRLERRLKKSPHGRGRFETIRSWFRRLPLNDKDKDMITSIYEKVRYGYKKINKNEWEVYQVAMESAKSHLMNRGIKE